MNARNYGARGSGIISTGADDAHDTHDRAWYGADRDERSILVGYGIHYYLRNYRRILPDALRREVNLL